MFALNQAIATKDPALLSNVLMKESFNVSAFVEAIALIDGENWWETHYSLVLDVLNHRGKPWLYAAYVELPKSPMVVAEYSSFLLETPCIDPALALHVAERAASLIQVQESTGWVVQTVLAHYLSALLACGEYQKAAEAAQSLPLDGTNWQGPGLCLLYFLSFTSPSLQLPEHWADQLPSIGVGRLINFIALHADTSDMSVTTRYKNACAAIEHYRQGFTVPMAGTSIQVPVDLIIHVLERTAAAEQGAVIKPHLEVIIRELNLDSFSRSVDMPLRIEFT